MKNFKNFGSKFITMLLLAVMAISNISLDVFASTPTPESEAPIDYIYLDGKRIRVDDKRIINTIPVRKSNPFLRSASTPPVESIFAIDNSFTPSATVSLQGSTVHSIRYAASTSDGLEYEVFCADPLRAGPETAGSGDDDYRILGESAIWLNALKYGYPVNPHLSDLNLPENVRMSNAYLTRVAVAMGRNSASNFSGDGTLIANANQLATQGGPPQWKNYDVDAPPITVNGKRDEVKTVTASGATAASGAFDIAYGRRTNRADNPFRFEWDSATPAGAELWVNGALTATAPTNVNTIFSNDNISSFELKMPNIPANENKKAKVNLVGIHNEWADKVWVLRHSSYSSSTITQAPTTGQRQDLVFYIPPVNASASFSFSTDGEPDPTPTPKPTPPPNPTPLSATGVVIQKIDAISRENIPGALMRLRGISANVVVTGGTVPSTGDTHWTINNTGINLSQVLTAGATTATGEVTSTVSDGVWSLEGLPYGAYIVEEERAPKNYSLLPQHTSYGFWLLPPDVTVDVTDVNVIQNPETGEVLETVVDYEIREDGNVSSILITFENFPFGEIEVTKYDEVTGETLDGAHFRIQGYFPEGNTNGMPIDRVQISGSDGAGKTIFKDLPAGQYTITEVEAPLGYEFDSTKHRSISLTWGQTANTAFYNKPKTFVEVIKVDGNDTNLLLDGARFKLSDPTSGETWEGTTAGGRVRLGEGEGTFGNQLVEGKLYILTEIQAPNGYVLNPNPIEVIVAADNQLNTITVRNYRNPSLTIVKRDKNNGQPRLEGAVFEVAYENGTTVNGSPFTTNANGEIVINEVLFEGNDERTLIIKEIIPPDGYNLSNPNWKNVTLRKGEDNVIVFENTRKPTLEIIKTDAITGQNLAGAEFTIEKLEEPGKGMLTGNPFTTDGGGRITLPFQYSGKYRIVEVSAPNNYWLNPQQQNREWIIEVKDDEDYTLRVENTLLPTLIITKWNAVTYKPVPLTHFRVEYEVPNSGQVQLVGEFVTNSKGQIVIPYTRVGWYRITETKAAPGMSLNTNNSYRVYLSPGDNSYMPIPDVTENNPNLNPQMPVFKDIQVFGGNDFFVGGTEQHNFPENSIVAIGSPNETFTISNANNARTARSLVQIDINAYTVGEFSADSSGILVIGGLQAASYTIANSKGRTETAILRGDGSVARFDFTAAATNPTPQPSTPPTNPPTNPDAETGDIFNGEIEYVDDPALVSQISQHMNVNNGEQYWNTGTGIWNWPLNSIVIKKQDATNGRLLAGATFDLIYTTSGESGTKGTIVGTFTTDHSGIIVITGLEPGNYVIEEIQAPPKYTLSLNNRQNVNLKPDGTSIVEVTYSNFPYGSLLISKIDSITRAPLAGAQFLVTDSKGTVVGSSNGLFTTDSAGNILIEKLPPDTYAVTEQRAPNGYVIGQNATKTIMIQPDGRIYRLEFTNDPLSSLIIRKIDSFDGSPLAGARFEVRRVNGEFIGEFTTDQQGLIEVPNILGWFTVTEMEAPSGYAVDTNAIRTVEVRSQAPTYVTFYNPREGSLTIEKADGSGNPLAGAEFRITRQSGEFVANRTTGASGMINLANLSAGWYHVEEINAPNGYVISQTGKSVEVKPNSAAHLTFVNLPQPTLTIQKVDETGNLLSGARFMVSEIGGSFSKEVTIGAGGTASLVLPLNKPQANFQIVETVAPQGYVITEPARVITVKAGENCFESFVNYKTPSLVINKLDVDGNPLSGAEFEVRTLDGALTATAKSNNGGVAAIGSIAPGSYEVRETRAPAGYVITEQSQIIQIVAGDTATATFVNERIPGLTIEKVDESGKPLGGAEFEVRTLAGTLVQRVTTNNGGVANIAQISVGSYTITEVKAPSGYVITEPSRNIEIVAGQSLTERFVNFKQPSIIIEKVDEDGKPLNGAVFEIRTLSGTKVAEVTTNNGGMATVPNLEPGTYEVVETRAPQGYVVTETSRAIQITAGETRTERFVNYRQPSLIIEKVDENGQPLAGAEFEIRKLNGELVHRVVTNNGGTATIAQLAPNSYEIIETRAPEGYAKVEVSRAIQIVSGQTITERFVNPRLATFVIKKIDGDTNEPLKGVMFEITTLEGEKIRNHQNGSFEFITDNAGMIRLPQLPAGSYVAVETKALPGYVLAQPEVFVVGHDKEYIITVRNYKLPDYNILKIDGNTDKPLAGVGFEIAHYYANGRIGEKIRNPKDGSFTWTTDSAGLIRIPNLAHGTYIATEIRPLLGYKEADPAIFVVGDNQPTTITVRNYRFSEWNILKINGDTNKPLQGVVFEVAHYFGDGSTGDKLRNSITGSFEFTTNVDGLILLGVLEPGTYIANETRPLDGYIKSEPTVFVVTENDVNTTVTIRNYKLATYNIRKIDGDTNKPLSGVEFEIAHHLGEGRNGERLVNPKNGTTTFVTDNAGMINLPSLEKGSYVAIETKSLNGYTSAEPTIFNVGENNQDRTIVIRNYRQAELTIQKINAVTRSPLEGVVFQILRPNGELFVNPKTGNHDFITDKNGLIYLPVIEDGDYYLTETKAVSGFIPLDAPVKFTINSETRQRKNVIVVENTPASGLLIIKKDAATKEPLAGVTFEIRHPDGRLIQGVMEDGNQPNTPHNSPQLNASNGFTTDNSGRINLNHLAAGVYHVKETKALDGYILDTTVHTVTIEPGKQAVLEVENKSLAGLRIKKIDAVTKQGIYNTEFMLFDQSGKVVGNFYSDNNGMVEFPANIVSGRYTIRETRPAPGYTPDNMPRTVDFVAGKVTEIVWENVPMGGQLQISKVSGDYNEMNALQPGTPLMGAIFEIYDARTGNVIDRIASNERGMAISRPLPLGRYYAQEVQAPAFYKINPQPINFDIEFDKQIIKTVFPNFSANVGVSINKTGPKEVMQGNNITYVVKDVRNESTIPLADFFWRDILPTNAIRADKLVTGTYNVQLRYKVMGKTNKGNEIVIADNLTTTKNNVVELKPAHLGLASDEWLVEFSLHFGQVTAGFVMVETAKIFADVLPKNMANLPNGMMFVNKVDVGGKIPGSNEWVISNSTSGSTVYNPNTPGRIPQSGY